MGQLEIPRLNLSYLYRPYDLVRLSSQVIFSTVDLQPLAVHSRSRFYTEEVVDLFSRIVFRQSVRVQYRPGTYPATPKMRCSCHIDTA